MIMTLKGLNLLNESVGIIVHCCNARGVMGSGFALQVKLKYPQVYKDYIELMCTTNLENRLGMITATQIHQHLYIVNLIGQLNYGRVPGVVYVNYDAIKKGFQKVDALARTARLPVMFPLLGAGTGGGDWNTIADIIDNTVHKEIDKYLYLI